MAFGAGARERSRTCTGTSNRSPRKPPSWRCDGDPTGRIVFILRLGSPRHGVRGRRRASGRAVARAPSTRSLRQRLIRDATAIQRAGIVFILRLGSPRHGVRGRRRTSGRALPRAPSNRSPRQRLVRGATAIQRAGSFSSSDLVRRVTAFGAVAARAVAHFRGRLRTVRHASGSFEARRRSNGQDRFHPPTYIAAALGAVPAAGRGKCVVPVVGPGEIAQPLADAADVEAWEFHQGWRASQSGSM
jgi:hypothetical protein